MAAIRVFLLTYRRPILLRRALASLRSQTFEDWVCELHNDDPDDEAPCKLLSEINDPRIILHQHTKNWGAVATFNHAYACQGDESYGVILEDDNWWEPDFLTEAIATLEAHPRANAVWSNMKLWQENPDGSWTDTGRTIWKTDASYPFKHQTFHWPEPLQCFDALHSQGAAVFRADASRQSLVPQDTPLAVIEPVRERLMRGQWLLLTRPLAHFALTIGTARSNDRMLWAQSQLLVAGSYIQTVQPEDHELAQIWTTLREQQPPSTNLLFGVALSGIRTSQILRHSKLKDWIRFLCGAMRHPRILLGSLRFRSEHSQLWVLLLEAANLRKKESIDQGSPHHGVFTKTLT